MRLSLALAVSSMLILFALLAPAGSAAADVTLNCTGATCTFNYLGAGSCSTAGKVVTVSYEAIAGGIKCTATCIASGTTAILVRNADGMLIDSVTMKCSPAMPTCGDPGNNMVGSDGSDPAAECGSPIPQFGGTFPTLFMVSVALVLLSVMKLRASRSPRTRAGI
jgi:hypothetical protein